MAIDNREKFDLYQYLRAHMLLLTEVCGDFNVSTVSLALHAHISVNHDLPEPGLRLVLPSFPSHRPTTSFFAITIILIFTLSEH